MPFGMSHEIILSLARWSVHGFYREVKTVGYENVPKEGPIIACSSHSNMIIDPAILSCTFPHKRLLHYWAKNSMFTNKIAGAILRNSGVVPVDRTTKNNQALFASTFEVLALGEVVAVFPEGTSHSETRLLSLKDGASWAALEYTRFINSKKAEPENNSHIPSRVVIIPCGITYVQKAKYRTAVVSMFGPPIEIEPYLKEFEKEPRATVKVLTKRVEMEMEKVTINAQDRETLNAAHMARALLFGDDKEVALEDFVEITQNLVNFFTKPTADDVVFVKNQLNQYKTTLDDLSIYNTDIARYDNKDLSLPLSLYTLLSDSMKSLVQLPFFLPGIIFHWPIYVLGKVSARFEIYEESKAQNKVMLGLLWLMVSYLILFFVIWTVMLFTPFGFVLAGGVVFIFAWYHIAFIDSHYDSLKDLISSYQIFSALANPKGSDARAKVEGLATMRRACLEFLKKVGDDYRNKDDHMKYVLEYRDRVRSGAVDDRQKKVQ